MSREILVNTLATDQFSIFEVDGVTKVSGLTDPADLTVIVWKDGVEDAVDPTITEIGSSGEYKMTFIPNAIGYWEVEITASEYDEIWHGQYTVSDVDLSMVYVYTKIAAGLSFHNIVVDNTKFDGDGQMEESRTRLFVDPGDVDSATDEGTIGGGDPTPFAEYEHATDWKGRNKPRIIKQKKVTPT